MAWSQIAGFAVVFVMVAAVLWRALARARAEARGAAPPDRAMQVYRDQLAEVDRDLARGTIDAAEAERVRLEVSRRILALDQAGRAGAGGAPGPRRLAATLVLGTLGAGAALYGWQGAPGYPDRPLAQRHAEAQQTRRNRPDQAALEARYAEAFPDTPAAEGHAELRDMVAQLRDVLAARPDDVTGHRLLARNEARLGNFRAAVDAQERVVALQGEDAELGALTTLLDLMAAATGGIVSPEQEAVIERILQRDAENPIALYYSGRLYAQTGRPDLTFRLWQRLHQVSPPGAPWLDEIRSALPELAQLAGRPRYELPPAPAAGPGPAADDLAAAQDMDPAAREDMVAGMVARLSDRLAQQGGSADEWAQLILSLGVLGRDDRAREIAAEARGVFAGNAEALAQIDAAARAAGVTDG